MLENFRTNYPRHHVGSGDIVIIFLVILVAAFFLSIYCMKIFKQQIPVEASKEFHLLCDNLDDYLLRSEENIPNLKKDLKKKIYWFSDPGVKSEVAVVYIHGYSASPQEVRPVPDLIAKELKANLYFSRLTGRGCDSRQMSEAQIQDWLNDAAEAVEIGHRIGKKVIVLSTSTGGTLVSALAISKQIFNAEDKLVFISPNFGLNKKMSGILTWPFSQVWLPLIFGSERTFKPKGVLHSYFWTTRYSTQSVIKMAKMTRKISKLDFSEAKLPSLFIYSKKDKVVKPWLIEKVFDAWEGKKSKLVIEVGENDDPNSHVICGDIMSPSMNNYFVDQIVKWVRYEKRN